MTENRTFGRRRALPAKAEEAPAQAAPRVGRGSVAQAAPAEALGGWDAMDKVASDAFADVFFRVPEEPCVIKVLDADPFDNYVCHWVDEISDGSKSVRCWGPGANCPLCGIGDKAKKFSACFSIISMEDEAAPALRVWEAGIKIAKQLRDIAQDPKKGPLDRPDLYFSIQKIAKPGAKNVEYRLERIRGRDLEEETGLRPLTKEVLELFAQERFTEPVKPALDRDEMSKIVALVMND